MKKIILTGMVILVSYLLNAQQTASYTTTSTFNYKAPEPILGYFHTNNPGITAVTWKPMNGWWRATYTNENNRLIRVYYSTQPYYLERGESFGVALPVLNTYVPEEVITNAINQYGDNLYSITKMKSADDGEGYQLILVDNGISRAVWLNGENTAFTNTNKENSNNK